MATTQQFLFQLHLQGFDTHTVTVVLCSIDIRRKSNSEYRTIQGFLASPLFNFQFQFSIKIINLYQTHTIIPYCMHPVDMKM